MPFRRKKRQTLGMASEQHAGSKIHIIGPGTILVANHVIRDSEVGPRDPAGGNDTIQLGRSFDNECNIGDICKYVNLFIQVGPRAHADASIGWVEWAFVKKLNQDAIPTNVNLGTQTLGTVCTRYFRNECIFTGAVPVGRAQPNIHNVTIKIPKQFQKLHVGEEFVIFLFARTVINVTTATDTFNVITSFIYRNYH